MTTTAARTKPRRFLVLALCVAALASPDRAQGQFAAQSYEKALRTVETSLVVHGGLGAIEAAGGITIRLEGTFDLSARLQGRSPDRPESTAIKETVVYDTREDRLIHEIDWYNYQFSNQILRELYDGAGRIQIMDLRAREGGWLPFAADPDAKNRYKRYLPNYFLADALDRRATLRALGKARYAGRSVDAVGYMTNAGAPVTLYVDRRSRLLLGAASVFDMELLGDTEIRWTWSGYKAQEGVMTPGRLETHLDGRLMKDVRLDVALGAAAAAFKPPSGIDAGAPPETVRPFADFTPYGQRPGKAEEIAPGVWQIRNLRPGFHMLFVEFKDFVIAVDAPTGWYEMQEIPPSNFMRGEGTSAIGAKYIRIIKETVPEKPIRYVALTHHHSDHIGGVRPFIAEGATILAAAPAAEAARKAASRAWTIEPDALTGRGDEPKIEIVEGERVISDGEMEVRLIELPRDNPKAEGFLVVYLPKQKIIYVTAFFYPVPEQAFPVIESIPLSLWFIRWLDQSGPEVERLYNVHAQGLAQSWQLDRLREMLASGEHRVAGE